MPKKRSRLIDQTLYALIGEAVVEFGKLENELRYSLATIICPAIGYPTNMALFARTRFSEMVDFYEFMTLYTLQKCEDDEILQPHEREVITRALKNLKMQLLSVNERRNTLVHSTYLETEFSDRFEGASEMKLEALKPFLNRRALDITEDFYRPSEKIYDEGRKLIADTRTACQDFLTFDDMTGRYRNQMWYSFVAWLNDQRSGRSK